MLERRKKKHLTFSEKFIQGWLPAILAAIIIGLLPIHQTPAIFAYSIPIAIISGLVLFFTSNLRDFLLLIIIYGVAFYAALHSSELINVIYEKGPDANSSDWVMVIQWLIIGLFALGSGILESLNAPPSWGRRCYFLAIASYFLGSATIASINGEWLNMIGRSLIGVIAIWGSIALPYLSNEDSKQKALEAKEPPLVEELKPDVKIRRYE